MAEIRNAKDEFIGHTSAWKILCASISHSDQVVKEYLLPVNYTEEDKENFLNELGKLNYNAGYGIQELDGYIWYTDGSWSEREEYDGSEWWEYKSTPSIDMRLFKKQSECTHHFGKTCELYCQGFCLGKTCIVKNQVDLK